MRAFVFLLVFANLVFFAWTQGYLGRSDNPDAARLSQQFAGDRLLILSRDKAPEPRRQASPERAVNGAAPSAPAATALAVSQESNGATPERCLAWTGLAAADADAVEALLAEPRFAGLRHERRTAAEGGAWWVFIPPLANKAEAERKASEVRRLGISQYFIVQEAGPNRFAISLGIFSSEKAAEAHLATLREQGVRSARTGPRPGGKGVATVEVSGAGELVDASGEAVRAALPAARQVACGRG